MAHSHDHAHGSTFYLDQLCTIAACAALGGVSIMMFLDGRLKYILTPFFFVPVMAGGVVLVLMAAIRAITLWREAGIEANRHHDHDAGHDHAQHDHEHHHGHDEHHHDHEHHHHDHGHSHDHGHDHDHGWTPARYVVLLLPVVLFFLNLPNSTFSAEGYANMMSKDEVDPSAGPVANKGGAVLQLGFKELSAAAYEPTTRAALEGHMGRLIGMYSPRSDTEFTLFRVKMNCCAADAIPVGVIIVCKENITRIQPKEWVEVEGQIQFRKLQKQDKYVPVLFLESANQVKPTAPENDYGFN